MKDGLYLIQHEERDKNKHPTYKDEEYDAPDDRSSGPKYHIERIQKLILRDRE